MTKDREADVVFAVLGALSAIAIHPRASCMQLAPPKLPRWLVQLGAVAASRAWEVRAPDWAIPIVHGASDATGVPASFIAAIIRVESGWRADAVSRSGALGLMQLMPATARQLGVDPLDPVQNVHGGATYIRQQLDTFDDIAVALAAYNAGPAAVLRFGGVPPFRETASYIARVLRLLRQ
jgi:soluble lytic murein transglycosylase-like protein